MLSTPLLIPLQDFGRELGRGNVPVFDPIKGGPAQMIPRPIQTKAYAMMLKQARKGVPIRIAGPKYRRAGFTTIFLCLAWCLCRYIPHFKAVVLAHTKEDVEGIFGIVLFLHEQSGLKSLTFNDKPVCDETSKSIEFPNGSKLVCRTMGSGAGLGRGSGFAMIHITELAYLQRQLNLDEHAMAAILNTVEDAPNTIIIAEGTGAGPTGAFYRICRQAEKGEGPFALCFTPWFQDPKHARPKTATDAPLSDHEQQRKAAFHLTDEQIMWYRHKRSMQPTDADMKREFPERLHDCFEVAEGRVLFTFSRDYHVTTPKTRPDTRGPGWKFYRSIDWGFSEANPFVCLWIAHLKSHSPRILIDHDVDTRLCDEMFAWARDPVTGKPLDKDDHGPDCIRYAITTFGLDGLVYVYRALYIQPCVSPDEAARAVHEASGWVMPDAGNAQKLGQYEPGENGESYTGSCCDRAGGQISRKGTPTWSFNQWGISLQPHKDPGEHKLVKSAGENIGVLEQGIALLLTFLSGKADMYTPRDDKLQALKQRVWAARHPENGQRPRHVLLSATEKALLHDNRDRPDEERELEYDPAHEFAGDC